MVAVACRRVLFERCREGSLVCSTRSLRWHANTNTSQTSRFHSNYLAKLGGEHNDPTANEYVDTCVPRVWSLGDLECTHKA